MHAMSKSRDIDIISGLPEDVILHILSFISTHQAVQMSLLSKRWRHLWTCIPVLFFNGSDFHKRRHDKPTAFHNFTRGVLLFRREDESIRKFHFKANCVDGRHVRQWVIDVAEHKNLEELVIDLSGNVKSTETELPHCLSSCLSLRVLKIYVSFLCVLKLPNELNLSGLKSLHLERITSVGDSLGKLISSCHFLEDLSLQRCQFDSLIISGSNLKKLSILFCVELKIKVSDGPGRLSFGYCPKFKQNCSLDNLVSLVEADIQNFRSWCLSEGMTTFCEILKGIRYASSLTLDYRSDQHLCLSQELVECLPVFCNLTRLVLNTWLNKDHVEAIINILERSPNLKTLILNKLGPLYSSIPEQEDSSWIPRDVSPLFSPHLRQIKIIGFGSCALQLEFVKLLLEYTRSMSEITIIPYGAIN